MESKGKDSTSCDLCNVDLCSIQEQLEHDFSLIHHMKLHQKYKNKTHSCSLCTLKVGSIKSYVSHLHGSKHQEFLTNQRKFWEKTPPTKADLQHRCHVVKIVSEGTKVRQTSNEKSNDFQTHKPSNLNQSRTVNASLTSNVESINDKSHSKYNKNSKHSKLKSPHNFVPGGVSKSRLSPGQLYNHEHNWRNHTNSNFYNPNGGYLNPHQYHGRPQVWFQNNPQNFQNWEGNFSNYHDNQNDNYWDWQTWNSRRQGQNFVEHIGGNWFESSSNWDQNPNFSENSLIRPKNNVVSNEFTNNPQINTSSETFVGKDISSKTNSVKKTEVLVLKKRSSSGDREAKRKKITRKPNTTKVKDSLNSTHKNETNATVSKVQTASALDSSVHSTNEPSHEIVSSLSDKGVIYNEKIKQLNIHTSPEIIAKKILKESSLKVSPKSTLKKSKSKNRNGKHMYFLSSDSDLDDKAADSSKFENSGDPKICKHNIEKTSEGQYNKELLNRLVNFPCSRKQQSQLAKWVQEHSKRKKKLILPRFNMHLVPQTTETVNEDLELRKVLSQMMTDLPEDAIDALVDAIKKDNNETEDQQGLEMILVPQEEEPCDTILESLAENIQTFKTNEDFKFNFSCPIVLEGEPEFIVPDYHNVIIKADPDGSKTQSSIEQINQSPFMKDHPRAEFIPPRTDVQTFSLSTPNILPKSPLTIVHTNSSSPRSSSFKSPLTEQSQKNGSSSRLSFSKNPTPNVFSFSAVGKSTSPSLESNLINSDVILNPIKSESHLQRSKSLDTEKSKSSGKLHNSCLLQPSQGQDNTPCQIDDQRSELSFQKTNQLANSVFIETAEKRTEKTSQDKFLLNCDIDFIAEKAQKKSKCGTLFSAQQLLNNLHSTNTESEQPSLDNVDKPSLMKSSFPVNVPHSTGFSTLDKSCPSPQSSSAPQQNWSELPSWIRRPSPDPSPSGRASTGSSKDQSFGTEDPSTTAHSIVDQLLHLSKEEEDLRDKTLKVDNIIVEMYKVLEDWKTKRAQLQQEELQMRNRRLNLLQVLQGSLSKEGDKNNIIFSTPEVSSSTSKVGACSSTTPEAEPQNVTYLGTLDSTWQLIQELGLTMSEDVSNSFKVNTVNQSGSASNLSAPGKKSNKKQKTAEKKVTKKKVLKKADLNLTKKNEIEGNVFPTQNSKKISSSKPARKAKNSKKKSSTSAKSDLLQDLLNHLVKTQIQLKSPGKKSLDQSQIPKGPEVSSTNVSENSEPDDRILNVESSSVEALGPFEAHESAVLDIRVANGFIYTCSADKTTKRFEAKNSSNCCVYGNHDKTVSAIQIVTSEGGRDQLFTGSHDGYLRCFDAQSGELLAEHFAGSSILCMTKSWGKLYLGLSNGDVLPYKFNAGKFLDKFSFSQNSVSKIATGTEGLQRLLCVITYDGTVSVRNADTGLLIRLLESKVRPPCCLVVDGSEVFITTTDKQILVHDLTSGRLLKSAVCTSSATSLHLIGEYVVSCSFDGFIRCYIRKTWHLHRIYYGAGKGMTMCMDISDGWVYSGNRHGIVEGLKLDHKVKALCSFQNCNFPFGLWEDLRHHISTDHLKNLTAKSVLNWTECPWKSCNFLLIGLSGIEKLKDLQDHIFHHVKNTINLS